MAAQEENPRHPLPLIGRKEYVSFPAWDLHRIRAKIDTGAFSSSLDVASYEILEGEEGPVVRLVIALSRRRRERVARVEEPAVGVAKVRNSTGQLQERPVIAPMIRLNGVGRRIRITVTDRSAMRCRMLLGRQAISGLFLVDVSQAYLLGK
jgi:hypothetical protein